MYSQSHDIIIVERKKESHVQHEENGFVHGSLSEITFFDGMTCLSIEDLPCYPRCTIKKICAEIGFLHPFEFSMR